jgi:hypothetical protein
MAAGGEGLLQVTYCLLRVLRRVHMICGRPLGYTASSTRTRTALADTSLGKTHSTFADVHR